MHITLVCVRLNCRMRLAKIIDGLNMWEKTPFVKILDSLAEKNNKRIAVESIITDSSGDDLKSVEGDAVAAIYALLEVEFVRISRRSLW